MRWTRLTPRQTHARYRVPVEIVANESNIFYGTESQPESSSFDDGPWYLWALLRHPGRTDVVTLFVHSLHIETLADVQYDPLMEQGSGSISMSRAMTVDFSELLKRHAEELPEITEQAVGRTFRQLQGKELTRYGLPPHWFPGVDFHLQIRDPLSRIGDHNQVTLLSIGIGDHEPAYLSLGLAQFPRHALKDSSFNPLDSSLGQAHLDREGMLDLANLLQTSTNRVS